MWMRGYATHRKDKIDVSTWLEYGDSARGSKHYQDVKRRAK